MNTNVLNATRLAVTQPNANQVRNHTMKTTINSIVKATRGMELFAPVLTGECTPVEWAQAIAKETVTTATGREISAARSALNGAQFGMTNLALAMRSATELGVLPYTQAVRETKRVYILLDSLCTAFAGVRNEAHRELTIAELTLEVKDGAFDGLQSQQDDEPYTEEELLDMGMGWEDIQEVLAHQARGASLSQSHLMDSNGDWSEDEGEYRTSIHNANQLWDMELRDIRWAETAAARVALIGVEWPTSNPMWEPLLDRLAAAWEASVEYADDKAAVLAKIAKREQALDDLHAKPTYARWAINHVSRRVFRDIEALKLRQEDAEERLAQLERRAMNEERYGVPANLTRLGTGEQQEYDREANLLYADLIEAEYAKDAEHTSQIERDRMWYGAIVERAGQLIEQLLPLHQELRTMESKLAKLWEIFQRDEQSPAQPPIYWGRDAFYLEGQEDEARAAIRGEAQLAKQKYREAEGDALVKAAELVAAMLDL